MKKIWEFVQNSRLFFKYIKIYQFVKAKTPKYPTLVCANTRIRNQQFI